MKVDHIVVGPLQSNCYIVCGENSLDAMIIDPGDEPGRIVKVIENKKLNLLYIICTHGHFDHIGAVSALKRKTGAKIVLHKDELQIYSTGKDQAAFWGYEIEEPPAPDMFVKEGDELSIKGVRFEVLHTPGHSPGGICLYSEGIIFTGDTIFAGSVGRTDFYGGSLEELKKSFKRIISLPPATEIFSGHGDFSTVQAEKTMNFFIHEL